MWSKGLVGKVHVHVCAFMFNYLNTRSLMVGASRYAFIKYIVVAHCISAFINFSPPTAIASECKVFLLYYLPAVLHGILPDKFLSHALILCKAIRLLAGDAVSYAEVDIAEELLNLFWRLTEKYYGQLHTQV